MNGGSLRFRLLLGAALWIGLALVAAGIVIASVFVSIVEREQEADLRATFNRVVALIDPEATPPALTSALVDPRYDTPFAGVYWQIADENGVSGRSRSLWDHELQTDIVQATEDGVFATLPGPAAQSLTALVRDIRVTSTTGERLLRVTIAEDRAAIDAAIGRFGWALAVALVVLAVALIAAAWLQVHLGLRPLENLRHELEAIRRGNADRLDGKYPAEVVPLAVEVNELLAAQQTSIEFARARAADLAHGLKTPLSVLGTIAEKLRDRSDASTADEIETLGSEMAERVDYQLRLSRVRTRTRAHRLSAKLGDALRRTIGVLQKGRDGERLQWEIEVDETLAVDIDGRDLIELVGVLLENAAKWAKSRVSIASRQDGDAALLEISDDGPGMTEAQIAALGERGRPLDESKKGTGFGVAIASEIVALNAGSLTFDRSPKGGLRVTLRLPLAGK